VRAILFGSLSAIVIASGVVSVRGDRLAKSTCREQESSMRTVQRHLSPLRSREALAIERLAALRAEVARILEQFPELRTRAPRKAPPGVALERAGDARSVARFRTRGAPPLES
jgi:hypothetical protein